MNSMIQQLPSEKNFGLGFNYERWTPNTTITLCKVPWNTDYRDVVRFANETALNTYLSTQAGPSITLPGASYVKFGRPISIDLDFSIAQQYNYVRVHNPAQPVNGSMPQYFYYFIGDVAYGAPNTTHLSLQLDVFQTFIYTTRFGNCYIDKGHIGIANSRGFDNYGRDNLTNPEGLDIGGEYAIIKQYTREIANAVPSSSIAGASNFKVMVVSTYDLTADPGTVDKPSRIKAKGNSMNNLPNGAGIYLFQDKSIFETFLEDYKDFPWVTEGIISITAIPKLWYQSPGDFVKLPKSSALVEIPKAGRVAREKTAMANNWRGTIRSVMPYRYRHLDKFLTFPYMLLELTSYAGNPVIIKPESWADSNATVIEIGHLAPPAQRIIFYPYRYNAGISSPEIDNADNANDVTTGVYNDGGEFLDMTTGINNFPTFSILNNAAIGYLASNANSIAYQHSSADWSQQKALTGAQLSQDQAYSGMDTAQDMTNIGINAAQAQTSLQTQNMANTAMLDAGQGIIGGIGTGPMGIGSGIAGAAMTGVRTGMAIDVANQSLGISNAASQSSTSRGIQQAQNIADTNKGYANMASRGDYANAIAGINARVQDAKMIQPTTSGQMGGDAFLLANYKWGYDLKIKSITGASMRTVGEYWLRYGYTVSTWGKMPADFHVMQNFTYWKLDETYIIESKCPESYKQTLRGIFEKGVTVWRNPQDIGTLDLSDNEPLAGITL